MFWTNNATVYKSATQTDEFYVEFVVAHNPFSVAENWGWQLTIRWHDKGRILFQKFGQESNAESAQAAAVRTWKNWKIPDWVELSTSEIFNMNSGDKDYADHD